MPQPTGPQPPGGGLPLPPDPVRAAAGRDIWRDTSRAWQAGQATSDASEDLRMKASKTLPQDVQAYS